jgi:hypothetical protein
MQVNLRHSKAAAASLSEVILENELYIILVQEPYACNFKSPTLVDIPPGYVVFHSLDRDHAYGAVILIKLPLAISCWAVSHCLANHVAAVDLHLGDKIFRFISMYVRPSCVDSSAEFRSVFHSLLSPLTVIGVDSNAKSGLWNSAFSDRKGVELEGILLECGLNVLNRNRSELDFVPSGTSFLDITLGTDDIVSPRWFFPTIPSLSDHPFIYFEISHSLQSNVSRPPKPLLPKLPHISQLDTSQLRLSVSSDLHPLPLLTTDCTKTVIDKTITDLVSVIFTSARKAKKSTVFSRTKLMPWWSTELCALRNKTRQAFKQWSVLKSQVYRDRYSSCKAVYQRELCRAKS